MAADAHRKPAISGIEPVRVRLRSRRSGRRRARRRRCSACSTASASPGATTRIRPMPMLNVRSMSSRGTAPDRWSHWKSGGTVHELEMNDGVGAVRQHARQVVGDAAAGDVRHALDRRRGAGQQRADERQVRAMRRQQRFARPSCPARARDRATDRLQCVEHDRCARASSRWCAGRTRARRSARRPAAMPRPSISRSRSTAPTMNPATSYSPSA